jgi:uncharacterized delta-60 repeat protein
VFLPKAVRRGALTVRSTDPEETVMKKTKRSAVVTGFAIALAVMLAAPASAAGPGDLDESYDYDGRVLADVFGGDHDSGYDVAVQPDGKAVVVGSRGGGAVRQNFALMRFNTNGSVDTSFASGGRTLTDFDGDDDIARGVKVHSDGKIVVGGSARFGTRASDFAIARYTSDGKLDPTFAGNGKAATDFGGRDEVWDIAIQPDGKIVTVGFAQWGPGNGSCTTDVAVARYLPDGHLDTTFSTDGKTTTGLGCDDYGNAVAIAPDGKIVVVGDRVEDDEDRCFGCNDFDLLWVRYNSNGTLDPTFDGDGKKTEGLGGIESLEGVAVRPDGKIVAAGDSTARDGDFFFERLNVNGSRDQSFWRDGRKWVHVGPREQAKDMLLQPDGKIVAAGAVYNFERQGYDFAVVRLLANGANDTSFSGDGYQRTPFGKSQFARGIARQSDGKIVAAGEMSAYEDADADFAIARYLG